MDAEKLGLTPLLVSLILNADQEESDEEYVFSEDFPAEDQEGPASS